MWSNSKIRKKSTIHQNFQLRDLSVLNFDIDTNKYLLVDVVKLAEEIFPQHLRFVVPQ